VNYIKQNTRRFAKRQITWFKKDKKTKWFEPHQTKEIKIFIGL
jgi:tRNA dimethylallyltransferase